MPSYRQPWSLISCIASLALLAPAHVRADVPLITVEASGAAPLSSPQSDRFGAGGAAAVSGYLALAPWLLAGVKLRAGFLSNGDAPANVALADPGVGTFETASALLRLRPFGSGDAQRARGLFIEAGPSAAITGSLVRPALEAAIGFGMPFMAVSLAPVVRYVQVVQPSDPLSSEDARLLLFGLELAVLDTAPPRAKAIVVQAPTDSAPEKPSDLDEDGVPDVLDKCKDTPEDRDGHLDTDGCPDFDNDADGIPDAQDKCPRAAEDKDGYEDEDGCPDFDNDRDTFLDGDDQCPSEAEIINGNQDYDGCPDEGLIEMHNDRIVLEERVLFDFERARVKTAALPILDAIVKLFELHPEWVKIRIEGHADLRGDPQYNLVLSERRAENVRKQLVERGIPASIIDSVGFGSEKPRDLREGEGAQHRNRRVDFVVVARAPTAAAPAADTLPPAPPAPPAVPVEVSP